VGVVETVRLNRPGLPGISTDAKANGSGGYDDLGICIGCAHLVDVTVDVDGRVPASSAVGGTRNTADVNIGEENAPGGIGRERPNTQRRPNTLPIDNGRAGKPGIAPRDVIESIDRFEEVAPIAQTKHARIIRSHVDNISSSHATRKLEFAHGERGQLAI
jgi:hypothetical protein